MVAVSCVDETKVVSRGALFHWMVLPATKPEPLTVSTKSGPPGYVQEGERLSFSGEGVKFLPFAMLLVKINIES